MKKSIITAILAACCTGMTADDGVNDITVTNFSAERNGNYIEIQMTVGMTGLKVVSEQCVLLTPRITKGNETLELPAIAVYGRNRYYHYLRNEGEQMVSGEDEITIRSKDKPDSYPYHELIPYREWMDGATITLSRTDLGCCRNILSQQEGPIGAFQEAFFPELVYIRPAASREKRRSLEGSAYIDFPVDQTIIYPDYHRNTAELATIVATIDTVRNDPDARIDTIWLKGWASPESPYSHNTDLAIGRTAALKAYLQKIYDLSGITVLTDYEPENWEGLRRFVEKSNLEHRDEIIGLIDSDMEPDPKEARIKKLYPEEYRFMLQQFYPLLRRTDYRVSYMIRSYSDPAEILRIMREHPQNLGPDEFYVAAGEFEPGTPEFTEVFETAVRMYPNDEIANLNAANAAMRRGDNETAEQYMKKAGNSPEAMYARGAIAIRRQDYAAARRYLQAARDAGLKQAAETLEELEKRGK